MLARLVSEGLISRDHVRTPARATLAQLRSFHGLDWIEACSEPRVVGRVFGLPTEQVPLEALLEAARFGVGATVEAMTEAAAGRLDLAIHVGGGFHHAEPELGSGFCLFNDVGVGIERLRASGFGGKIAIVDLDYHQGNGNTAAFAHRDDVLVASLHGAIWSHAAASDSEIHLEGVVDDTVYLEALERRLLPQVAGFQPSLVVYVAGADILATDQLGTFSVSPRGVFARDQAVARLCGRLGVPLVVTFGGGYSAQAWLAHFELCRALISGVWKADPPSSVRRSARFAEIAASIGPLELQGGPDDAFGLTEEDVFGGLYGGPHTESRFLGYYSVHGLEVVMERYGLFEPLRARGYEQLRLEAELSDPARQVIRCFGTAEGESHLLIELVARRAYRPSFVPHLERLEVIHVEWLLLQDPCASFSLHRPPLPGQSHPGLGVALDVQELLVRACHRLELQGLVNRPAHYHNAWVGRRSWRFVEPRAEGRFQAMTEVLVGRDVAEASTLVEQGRLQTADGMPVVWEASELLMPVDPQVAAFFDTAEYGTAAERERLSWHARGLHALD